MVKKQGLKQRGQRILANGCKEYILHTGKILCNMATTKTTTTWAMRLSARPTTMLTSTVAWCTPCVERAHTVDSFTLDVVSHLIGSSPESFHNHFHSHPWAHLFDTLLPLYFYLFFLFPFYLLYSELYPELDNPIFMEILCYSANKESEDAYDVPTSLTG